MLENFKVSEKIKKKREIMYTCTHTQNVSLKILPFVNCYNSKFAIVRKKKTPDSFIRVYYNSDTRPFLRKCIKIYIFKIKCFSGNMNWRSGITFVLLF